MRRKLTDEERARLAEKTTILIDALKEASGGEWYGPGDRYSDEINREKLSPEAKRTIPEDWKLGKVQSMLFLAQQFRDSLSEPCTQGRSMLTDYSEVLEIVESLNCHD